MGRALEELKKAFLASRRTPDIGFIGGFHGGTGTPIAGWFIVENPTKKI